jgi:zinc protease
MKKLSILFVALIAAIGLEAQELDRSIRPTAQPAPELNIGEYEVIEMKNGLKVFVVQNDRLPRVTFRLVLDRDPILEGDKSGYVGMAGSMMDRGTTTRTKAEIDEEIDFLGASLSTSSTGVFGNCLSAQTEEFFEIYADVLLNPSFPEEEFEKLKKENLDGLEFAKDNPDAISAQVWNRLMYGAQHPYGDIERKETVEAITLEDCKEYYDTYYRPNIAYLAIVGDISKGKAKKLVKKYLSDWEAADVPTFEYISPYNPAEMKLAVVNRDESVQSIVQIGNLIDLEPGHPDIVKVSLMNQVLGGGSQGRLYKNIREDKGYTYGAYSSYSTDELVGEFSASASVRNEVTDSALAQFFYELNRIRTEPVDEADLQKAKNYKNGTFALSLENPNTVANFALNTARYGLPEDYYATYLQRMSAVTVEDIQAMAQEHIKPENATVLIVGKGDEIMGGLSAMGTIEWFDIYGEPTTEPSIPIPAGVTAETVIEDYLAAIGGREKLSEITEAEIKMEISMQGMRLQMDQKYSEPDKMAQDMSMGSMAIFSMRLNGDEAKMTQQGQDIPMGEEEIADLKRDALIFPELHYEEMGVQAELSAIKRVNGAAAYEMVLTMPNGDEKREYYDVESGYKVRSSVEAEGPEGPIVQSTDYADYQDFDGVMYPGKVSIPLGPQKLDAFTKEVNFAPEFEAGAFDVK